MKLFRLAKALLIYFIYEWVSLIEFICVDAVITIFVVFHFKDFFEGKLQLENMICEREAQINENRDKVLALLAQCKNR